MIESSLFNSARARLFTRAQLAQAGRSSNAISAAVKARKIERVRPGWFSEAEAWQKLYPEQRHLLRVIALAESGERRRLRLSHYSAAVLHGLPLYRLDPDERVHVSAGRNSAASSDRVIRHRALVREEEWVTIHGITCTNLARTVTDVARAAPPALALGCADAALEQAAAGGSDWREWRAELLARCDEMPRARGIARAKRLLRLAEPGADSVLESVSRLYFTLLGFDVRTQVAIPGPHGHDYRVDFEIMGCGVFGEVDGRVKYTEATMTRGRSAEEVFFEEKRREDWIRGTTSQRLIRWGAAELRSLEIFAQFLRGVGLHPRMPASW